MALAKFQSFIQKLSESENVKKVVVDIQNLSTEIQHRVQNLNTNDAVKKYKEIVKKVSKAENDLQKEVNKVIVKIKKSATDVEKNLGAYKKKAVTQKNKLEKILKTQKGKGSVAAKTAVKGKKSPAKKAAKRPAKKKTAAK